MFAFANQKPIFIFVDCPGFLDPDNENSIKRIIFIN